MSYGYFSDKYLLPTQVHGDNMSGTQEKRKSRILDNQLYISLWLHGTGNGVIKEGMYLGTFSSNNSTVQLIENKPNPALECLINQVYGYTTGALTWTGLANNTIYYLYANIVEQATDTNPSGASTREYKSIGTSFNITGITPTDAILIATATTTASAISININPSGKRYIKSIEDTTDFVSGITVFGNAEFKKAVEIDGGITSGINIYGNVTITGTGNTFAVWNPTTFNRPVTFNDYIIGNPLTVRSGEDVYGNETVRGNLILQGKIASGIDVFGGDSIFRDDVVLQRTLEVIHGTTLDSLIVRSGEDVYGNGIFHDNVTIQDNLTVLGKVDITKNLIVRSGEEIFGDSVFRDKVTVQDGIDSNSPISTSGLSIFGDLYVTGGFPQGADEKARVTITDTTPNFLASKIVAGANVTVTTLNPGGDETLRIASTGGSGSPGGNNTEVQYNDAAAFGGAAGLRYNNSTHLVTINSGIDVTGTSTFRGNTKVQGTLAVGNDYNEPWFGSQVHVIDEPDTYIMVETLNSLGYAGIAFKTPNITMLNDVPFVYANDSDKSLRLYAFGKDEIILEDEQVRIQDRLLLHSGIDAYGNIFFRSGVEVQENLRIDRTLNVEGQSNQSGINVFGDLIVKQNLRTNFLQVSQNVNDRFSSGMENPNAGTAAITEWRIGEDITTIDSKYFTIGYVGSGYTPSGYVNPNQADIIATSLVTNGFVIGTNGNAPIKFVTNQAERIRIEGGGNIGIGTTSAQSKLHFVSTGAGYNPVMIEDIIAATTGGDIFLQHARGTTEANKTILLNNDVMGGIYARGYDGFNYQTGASIEFEVDGTPGATDMPGRIVFSTTPDNSSTLIDRFIVNSNGHLLPAALGYNIGESGLGVSQLWVSNVNSSKVSFDDGTTLTTGGSSGATTALDNLASVAINTHLLPSGDSSIDLGTSTGPNRFRVGYFDRLNVNDGTLADDTSNAIMGIINLSGAGAPKGLNLDVDYSGVTANLVSYGIYLDCDSTSTGILSKTYGLYAYAHGAQNSFGVYGIGEAGTNNYGGYFEGATADIWLENRKLKAGGTWTFPVADAAGVLYSNGSGTLALGDTLVADGGTGASTATLGFNALSPVTTRGDIIVRDATNNIRLALGSAGKILRSDGTDLVYSTSTFADTYTASTLLYSNGANTVQGLATANDGVLVTSATGVPSIAAAIAAVNLPTGSFTLLTFDMTATALTSTNVLRAFTLPANTYAYIIVMCGWHVAGGTNEACEWNVQVRDNTVVKGNAVPWKQSATGTGDTWTNGSVTAAIFTDTSANSVDAYGTEVSGTGTLTADWFVVLGVK